jgi:hypothetical protein
LTKKPPRYRKCGTKEVWLLSIEARGAHPYSESRNMILEENSEFRSDLIPGFSIRLGELFGRV